MADVKRLEFGEREIYTIYRDDHKAVALDDIALAIGLLTGDQLVPLIKRLDLNAWMYDTPLVPRGKVQMIMVEAACEMLRAYGTDTAERLAEFLQEPSNFDRKRYEGMSPAQIRRKRVSEAVKRILLEKPDATCDAVASQLDIAPEEAAHEMGFLKMLDSVVFPSND
jgi:hypothetical protein